LSSPSVRGFGCAEEDCVELLAVIGAPFCASGITGKRSN